MIGVLLGIQISEGDIKCPIIMLMLQLLHHSGFKDVRRKILKLVKFDKFESKTTRSILMPLLIDKETEIRMAAYQKVLELNIGLDAHMSNQAIMTLVIEGMRDESTVKNPLTGTEVKLRDLFTKFIGKQIVQQEVVLLEMSEFQEFVRITGEDVQHGPIQVSTFCPMNLTQFMDQDLIYSNDYFYQMPRLMIGCFFWVL